MPNSTLSSLLRRALDEVRAELESRELELAARTDPALTSLTLQQLLDIAGPSGGGLRGQDRLLLAVVRCFRFRPRRLWSPVLLDVLAQGLDATARQIAAINRAVDPVDVQQQLLEETMTAALSMPLDEQSRWVRRRLLLQAASRTRRRLKRAARHSVISLDALASADGVGWTDPHEAAVWELSDLRMSNPRSEDLWLLVQLASHGRSLAEVAADLDISPNAVEIRYRRARARLRALLSPDNPSRVRPARHRVPFGAEMTESEGNGGK